MGNTIQCFSSLLTWAGIDKFEQAYEQIVYSS
jgi:hypothetical protein